jgi:hypothetical protein
MLAMMLENSCPLDIHFALLRGDRQDPGGCATNPKWIPISKRRLPLVTGVQVAPRDRNHRVLKCYDRSLGRGQRPQTGRGHLPLPLRSPFPPRNINNHGNDNCDKICYDKVGRKRYNQIGSQPLARQIISRRAEQRINEAGIGAWRGLFASEISSRYG